MDAAILELQAVINDALFDVRTKFYTVLVNREKIKVQEKNVELLQRQLQDVKNRFDAGTVSNFEVLRAEVSLANAQTPLITARNDYRLSIEEPFARRWVLSLIREKPVLPRYRSFWVRLNSRRPALTCAPRSRAPGSIVRICSG